MDVEKVEYRTKYIKGIKCKTIGFAPLGIAMDFTLDQE